jgi:hypothetical protein
VQGDAREEMQRDVREAEAVLIDKDMGDGIAYGHFGV